MIGWRDLSAEEAHSLDLEQAGRWQWQMWCIELFGRGIGLAVRVKPERR